MVITYAKLSAGLELNVLLDNKSGYILNVMDVLNARGIGVGHPAAILFHTSKLKKFILEDGALIWENESSPGEIVFRVEAKDVLKYGKSTKLTEVDFPIQRRTLENPGQTQTKTVKPPKPKKEVKEKKVEKYSKEYWKTHSAFVGQTTSSPDSSSMHKAEPKKKRKNVKKSIDSDWVAVKQYEDITYRKRGGVARIAFNRPEVRNAFRPKTLFELEEALKDAREDVKIGVVLLTGEGPAKDAKYAFCSGGDQKVRGARGYEGDDGVQRLNVLDIQRLIRVMSKVVICVVPGWAVGGGHSLHVVCDMTIASKEHAIFKQTDADVASFDGGYGSAYLAKQVGQKRAREIFFLGRNYSAQEAFDMGMVNAVVPHAEIEDIAFEWAQEILKKSPTAIRMIKFAFNLTDEGIAGQQVFAGEATRLAYMTEEAEEGRKAFLEKRDPDFSKFPWLSL